MRWLSLFTFLFSIESPGSHLYQILVSPLSTATKWTLLSYFYSRFRVGSWWKSSSRGPAARLAGLERRGASTRAHKTIILGEKKKEQRNLGHHDTSSCAAEALIKFFFVSDWNVSTGFSNRRSFYPLHADTFPNPNKRNRNFSALHVSLLCYGNQMEVCNRRIRSGTLFTADHPNSFFLLFKREKQKMTLRVAGKLDDDGDIPTRSDERKEYIV